MTRIELRDYATQLYYTAVHKYDLDDQQWNLLLDTFNKKYWGEAARGLGSMLAIDTGDLGTDANGVLNYAAGQTGFDANGAYSILAVECKFQGRYLHLDYEIPQDRYLYNIAFGQVQALIPSSWTLIGEKINLLPKVSASQILRVTYVPRVGDWLNDTDPALRGFLPDWHQLIAYEAAATAAPQSLLLTGLKNELKSQWNEFLQSRQRQEGRKIRFVPYE